MNRRLITLTALGLAVLGAPGPALPADTLLERMSAINPTLHSFSAKLHAHVTMRSFPYLTADLAGTYYYKQPDKNKVIFESGVPLVGEQFDKLYAHIEPPARWQALYDVKIVSDDGTTTAFALTPRKHGNVSRIDATADDRAATVTSMRWNYANGGYAAMTNHYGRQNGNFVVESQSGHVSEPGYVADLTSTIDDYTFNPSLPDAIFASP